MTKFLSIVCCTLILVSAHTAGAQTKTQAKQIKEFDAYVENARKQWGAVGLAVAVVKDGQVIFEKGYGVKELNTTDAVDTHTLFAIGSTTKAITATCMGILVDRGKVNWDDHVIDYLPEFQLYDPFVTRELTIRDLFLHNSGVGNTDFLWSWMTIDGDEVLRRMRWVEPTYSFRAGFIYQNIFYLAAGKVIEKISGKTWYDFMNDEIFKPLQMTETVPRLQDIKSPNKTKPHMTVNGKMAVIEDLSADNIGSAGSVWSSISDIAKWTQCMLDSGKYKGGRLVEPKTWIEMTKVQTIVPSSEFYPTAQLTKPNWTTYGMGWFQHDYKGRKVNFHTGSLPGSIAIHGQIPEENVAVYVFGNTDHVEVRHAIMYKAFDAFALGGSRDWSAEFLTLYTNLAKGYEAAENKITENRVKNTKPSHDLADYAGEYSDPLYGTAIITVSGDQLSVSVNKVFNAKLSHWHYDTFRGPAEKEWYGQAMMSFEVNNAGKIAALKIGNASLKKIK